MAATRAPGEKWKPKRTTYRVWPTYPAAGCRDVVCVGTEIALVVAVPSYGSKADVLIGDQFVRVDAYDFVDHQ